MSFPISEKNSVSWRHILRQNFTRLEPLAEFLDLTVEQREYLLKKPRFPLNLPLRLAQKMAKGTLDDPILKQFIPFVAENKKTPHFSLDPIGDAQSQRQAKLLHKYQGRVLLVCTSACAMHCRYCFRQYFDYETGRKSFFEEIRLIEQDSSIHEVILSGGDPLSLSNETLQDLLYQIGPISHVKRIRFHTRFPIGIPERIDEPFLDLISRLKQQIWFVIHTNHPNELDPDIFTHLKRLQRLGCPVLNQAVLLRGINDEVETLKILCESLVDQGILPYYLHQLDQVQGAAHFEVEEAKGRALIQELSTLLPGYAVPKYVRELAGEPSKIPC
jgi:EF-P beta-lysylation protein EpmB